MEGFEYSMVQALIHMVRRVGVCVCVCDYCLGGLNLVVQGLTRNINLEKYKGYMEFLSSWLWWTCRHIMTTFHAVRRMPVLLLWTIQVDPGKE